ncbi:MAG TPA: NAD(P)/FAD-dependent oxidoreductase [Trebonia sp.]|nr:NAD(P)/FAD-dependent oxidoreductase [Trebonia sp.]
METYDVIVIGAGQSGLAAARALRETGADPVVLEASDQPGGSWPRYYDSLTLFSPARYSALPGLPFGGDPDRYPRRDDVTAYLREYAARLGADIRTGSRVTAVTADGAAYTVRLADGTELGARAVIAATGSFSRPYRPALAGLGQYAGTLIHASEYRQPGPFAGRHVIVVGAGNSAVQIAAELAGDAASVTLATRKAVRYAPQRPLGRDLHFWFKITGIDTLPAGRWISRPPTVPVFDDGRYRAAIAAGRPVCRPVFTAVNGTTVTWPGGDTSHADAIVLATGYRPALDYLAPLGALGPGGYPLHRGGLSATCPGLAYVGLEWQRSLSSASLRGVGRDARYVAGRLSALRGARRR